MSAMVLPLTNEVKLGASRRLLRRTVTGGLIRCGATMRIPLPWELRPSDGCRRPARAQARGRPDEAHRHATWGGTVRILTGTPPARAGLPVAGTRGPPSARGVWGQSYPRARLQRQGAEAQRATSMHLCSVMLAGSRPPQEGTDARPPGAGATSGNQLGASRSEPEGWLRPPRDWR
jgi:hypothetical protein